MWKYKETIDKLFNELPKDFINKKNQEELEKSRKEYREFEEYYNKWQCNICKNNFKVFSSKNPCLHYLLRRTNKFKTKNFKDIYEKWWYFNIATYLRWVANKENFMLNINDLEDEKWKNKKFEYTIKWKNIEWTFSCSESDFIWHTWTKSDFPHYHFQMKIDWKVFIKFWQFHIPFKDYDFFMFDIQKSEKGIHSWWWWEWISDFFDTLDNSSEEMQTEFFKELKYTENEELAQTRVQTFIEWPMDWNLLNELIQKRKDTWKIMNTLLKEEYPNHKVKTIISPSDNIPDIANRV